MGTPDPTFFTVQEQGGLRLITPSHQAAAAPWTKETVKYRSRIETLDGHTVSQGFFKFFNLGQGPIDWQITFADIVKACEREDAAATLKIDGSLLIRSEWRDQVSLRTRGSFGYAHLANAGEMDLFRQRHPCLFQAGVYQEISLLLEWVSPQNVIVLKYPEPTLTLLGAVRHLNLTYLTLKDLRPLSVHLGIPLVQNFPLTPQGWQELHATLDSRRDIEGYVIRLHNEQDLVKVKCLPYLTKHALKSTLSSEKLADMYFQQGRPTFAEFCEQFKATFDEETCLWALGAISNLYDGVRTLEAIERHLVFKAAARKGWTRKDAALAGLDEYGQTKKFSAYMQAWQGSPIDTKLLKSLLLQNTKQVEVGMFVKMEG